VEQLIADARSCIVDCHATAAALPRPEPGPTGYLHRDQTTGIRSTNSTVSWLSHHLMPGYRPFTGALVPTTRHRRAGASRDDRDLPKQVPLRRRGRFQWIAARTDATIRAVRILRVQLFVTADTRPERWCEMWCEKFAENEFRVKSLILLVAGEGLEPPTPGL
jgi:hypothetical protein